MEKQYIRGGKDKGMGPNGFPLAEKVEVSFWTTFQVKFAEPSDWEGHCRDTGLELTYEFLVNSKEIHSKFKS